MVPKTRSELAFMLKALDPDVARLSAEYPQPEDFWPAFAGLADEITDNAAAEDFAWANEEIAQILARHGFDAKDEPA